MKFKRDIKIRSYKLSDPDESRAAMMELSKIDQVRHKYTLCTRTIEEDALGGVTMTLEWIDYVKIKDQTVPEQVFDCAVVPLSPDDTEASNLLTNAEDGAIKIIERREWVTRDGDSLIFLLWKLQPNIE